MTAKLSLGIKVQGETGLRIFGVEERIREVVLDRVWCHLSAWSGVWPTCGGVFGMTV